MLRRTETGKVGKPFHPGNNFSYN